MASRQILSHFAIYAFQPAYWKLADEQRDQIAEEWRTSLAGAAEGVHFYRTYGSREGSDALVWSSAEVDTPEAPAKFFERLGDAQRPFRRYVRLRHVLWGLTAESPYARGGPARGIDPFKQRSLRYLIVYPFAKTHEWYRTPADARKSMMAEHIQIGRGHSGIDQLLLYSTGLQDHEFVVVYETDDLGGFSGLVRDLRATEARAYTLLDSPVHVGVYVSPTASGSPWP